MGSSGECAYQLQEDGADKRSTNGKETEGPTRRKQNKNNSESRKKKAESRGGRDEGGEVEREREREKRSRFQFGFPRYAGLGRPCL